MSYGISMGDYRHIPECRANILHCSSKEFKTKASEWASWILATKAENFLRKHPFYSYTSLPVIYIDSRRTHTHKDSIKNNCTYCLMLAFIVLIVVCVDPLIPWICNYQIEDRSFSQKISKVRVWTCCHIPPLKWPFLFIT